MTKFYARQGDLVIREIESSTLSDATTKVTGMVLAGSHSGHTHRIVGDALVDSTMPGVTYVQPQADTVIVHDRTDGHRDVPLAAGRCYEIAVLRERSNTEDRAVED